MPKLAAALREVPDEALRKRRPAKLFYLPDPKGGFAAFKLYESSVMAPELAAKYPEIKTYIGYGIDDPSATVRISKTPLGFHAQVLSPNGTCYIDPAGPGNPESVICYRKSDYLKSDYSKSADVFCCPAEDPVALQRSVVASSTAVSSGNELRTYRLACAATAEYTADHGGTVASGLAAIVTAINRVTGIYEAELSIRLELVANNNLLIYTNPQTDPYTNDNDNALIIENQANIDAVIGNANYDIGHVFSTGDGGLAVLGSVGINSVKAQGKTGSADPVGDPFYVDFLAHEIGHQFGATHTFNGDSCVGQYNAGTAYEPGSGNTILAYAGICGNDDLQSNSDPYFHFASLGQIIAHVDNVIPAVGTRVSTGNWIPVVNAGADYTIPANTPFVLTAAGWDADPGDVLSYNWEERNLGPRQDVSAGDNGSSPLFRSWLPTLDSSRTLPRLSDLVSNTTVAGETLPTTTRAMNFRVTVRDNASGGGGVNADDMVVNVVNTGAAFAVTYPNSAVDWPALTEQTVTWNVAGTTGNGINAANVSIFLSTDGGLTYPHTLLASTPNDGLATVLLPDSRTTQARIRVQGGNNIFFDISDTDFTISAPPGFELVISPDPLTACQPNDALYTIDVNSISGFLDPVTLSVNGVPAGATASFATNPVTPGSSTSLILSNIGSAITGNYVIGVSGVSGALNFTDQAMLELSFVPAEAALIEPTSFATITEFSPGFSWSAVADVHSYQFDLATDANFTNVVHTSQVTDASIDPGVILSQNTTYFWRVTTINNCGNTVSATSRFTTASELFVAPACDTMNSALVIPDDSGFGVSNQIVESSSGILADLNVSIEITHTWVGDLTVTLSHDDGSTIESVELVARPGRSDSGFGSSADNMYITLDDEGVDGTVEDSAPYNVGGSYTPNNPLSAFDGRTLSGTWTLNVSDSVGGDTGTLDAWCLVPIIVADVAAPVVQTLTPASGAVNPPIDADLQIEFNELVQAGAGNIIVRLASDDSVVETISVNSPNVTIDEATVTIDLPVNLTQASAYYVQIDAGAFRDLAGNAYAGIAGKTTWNFTTQQEAVIPTMSEWGIILLVLLLLIVAGYRMLEQQAVAG